MATTNASIRQAIATAVEVRIQPAEMVALLDRAIAAAHLGGLAVVQYSVAGRSVSRPIDQALELRRYYADLAAAGGGVFALAEF